jgi:hypothetical protein
LALYGFVIHINKLAVSRNQNRKKLKIKTIITNLRCEISRKLMEEKRIIVNQGVLDDIELPPIVYKYRTWSDDFHKRFITEREVFMASARTFEDQLDCRNPTRFDLLNNEQIYEYYFWSSQKENPHFSRQQHRKFSRYWAKHSPIKDKKTVEKWMNTSLEEYYDHDGILSLTENCNNNLMWEKYADNERGFCIGYNTREMFKHIGGGGKVDYVDTLPIILPEPFMHFAEALKNRVYSKVKFWNFEEEYRTKKFWLNPATIQDRQIVLPKSAFNKIILGNKISINDKKEIIELTRTYIGDIEIVQKD